MSRGTSHHAIRIPDTLWHQALTLAKTRGDNLSEIIRAALVAYVKEWGTE